MFVCTQFSLCAWLYKGKRYSPLTYKIFCVMMIDEEYTICLRFPGRKRYSPLMFRKMERIVGYDSFWFKVYLYVVKGQERIHVIQFQ